MDHVVGFGLSGVRRGGGDAGAASLAAHRLPERWATALRAYDRRVSISGRVVTVVRRRARWVRRALAIAVSACALLGAVRLTVPATAGSDGVPIGVKRQLTFLRAALHDGAAERGQQAFPEGYFFLHALYGLAWVEVGMREPGGTPAEAVREARWVLQRLDSPTGRAPFSADLLPSYGVFYRGWSNWLRGGMLSLQPVADRDPQEVRRFEDDSAALASAFDASPSPFLAAYPGQAWPVDSTVAMASLRLHDRLFPARFAGTVGRWTGGVRRHLDPGTGLLPHRVDLDTGQPTGPARGSSQSIIQRLLVEIDPSFAADQYLRFRDRFVVRPLGLGPGVREYPRGTDGPGDVDSGPLLLGVSLSASVVTIGAAQVHGDSPLASALANYVELAGLPVDTPWTKRYALGQLPIGDAFLAWSKTARPWTAPTPPAPPRTVPWWWQLPLLALLTGLGTLPWLPTLRRRFRHPGARPGPAGEIDNPPSTAPTQHARLDTRP